VDGYRDAKRGDGFVLDRGSSHPFDPTAAAGTTAPGTTTAGTTAPGTTTAGTTTAGTAAAGTATAAAGTATTATTFCELHVHHFCVPDHW
jgi:hypothetical protein